MQSACIRLSGAIMQYKAGSRSIGIEHLAANADCAQSQPNPCSCTPPAIVRHDSVAKKQTYEKAVKHHLKQYRPQPHLARQFPQAENATQTNAMVYNSAPFNTVSNRYANRFP
ncbi:hypothetical protein BV914_04865 [Neisseria dumasiana]|nr:hypothetical protein BV914_04865 [Neisseria dumasiana]